MIHLVKENTRYVVCGLHERAQYRLLVVVQHPRIAKIIHGSVAGLGVDIADLASVVVKPEMRI